MDPRTLACVYYIKVLLEGLEEPLVFPVTKEDADRFSHNFQNSRDPFFVFPTITGKHVALNLASIQLANLLWDPIDQAENKDEEGGDDMLLLYFRGKKAPFHSSIGEPTDIADILFMLEMGVQAEQDPALCYTDGDGELVLFNPAELLYLEAPTSTVLEGEADIDEDLKAGEKQTPSGKPPNQTLRRTASSRPDRGNGS